MTAVNHQLAQGWNAHNTKVGQLLEFAFFIAMEAIVRSFIILGHSFERLLWRKEETVEQAIHGILCDYPVTVKFAVTVSADLVAL